MKTPILAQKLKLPAAEYYILEQRVIDALQRGELTYNIIAGLITRDQYKYFKLRLMGYNFCKIARNVKPVVTDGSALQACKRGVLLIIEYLNKKAA